MCWQVQLAQHVVSYLFCYPCGQKRSVATQADTAARELLDGQVCELKTALTAAQDSAAQFEKDHAMLQQQLLALHAASDSAQADARSQKAQLESQVQLLQLSSQQQSAHALELAASNSGLATQLDMLQAQHAQQLDGIRTEIAAPLQKHIVSLQQQLKGTASKAQGLEQQLKTQELRVDEAESRAARAEGLVKRGEERRNGLEGERRRLQQSLRELRNEVGHVC